LFSRTWLGESVFDHELSAGAGDLENHNL